MRISRLAFVLAGVTLLATQHIAAADPGPPASDESEIGPAAQIGGGLTSLVVGFGTGQAIQGRWLETGWKYTLADTVVGTLTFGTAIAVAPPPCMPGHCTGGLGSGAFLLIGEIAALGVLRIAETYDAVEGANRQNERVRQLRARSGLTAVPYLAPAEHGDGAIAGAVFRL